MSSFHPNVSFRDKFLFLVALWMRQAGCLIITRDAYLVHACLVSISCFISACWYSSLVILPYNYNKLITGFSPSKLPNLSWKHGICVAKKYANSCLLQSKIMPRRLTTNKEANTAIYELTGGDYLLSSCWVSIVNFW